MTYLGCTPPTYFPAPGTSYSFSRAWHRSLFFPRLTQSTVFPAPGTDPIFSLAWHRLRVLLWILIGLSVISVTSNCDSCSSPPLNSLLQVAARSFGIPVSKIHITETSTNTVANTSPTAASASSDLNGMAVKVSVYPFTKYGSQGNIWGKWTAQHREKILLKSLWYVSSSLVSVPYFPALGNGCMSVSSPNSYWFILLLQSAYFAVLLDGKFTILFCYSSKLLPVLCFYRLLVSKSWSD